MKRIGLGLAVLLFVGGTLFAGEEWRIKLEEAKVYLDQKQYQDAEAILAELVKEHSDQWEINYYLGLVKLAQDKMEEAEKYLRTASEQSPSDLLIRVNLSFVLIKLGRVEEAKKELKMILVREPDNASALYLRGICYVLENNCGSAKSDLTKVMELDPAYRAQANYYLGLCELNLGKTETAREHFDQAIEQGRGTVWASKAEEAFSQAPKRKPWFISGDLFYQYDSNIVPVSSEDYLPEEISEESDSRAVLWLDAGVKPLLRDKGGIGIEGRLYSSWHFEEEELNLQVYQGVLNGFYNFELSGMKARIFGQYLYQYASLGEDSEYYSTTHQGSSVLFLAESNSLVTELDYQFEDEIFDEPGEEDFDRDNNSHQVMLGQHFYFGGGKVDLAVFGRYRAVLADGKNYDQNRYGGRLLAQVLNWRKISGWAYLDYDYRDYYRSTFDRLDRVYSARMEIQYQIIKPLAVFAGVGYSDYESNTEEFDYERAIYSGGVRASY